MADGKGNDGTTMELVGDREIVFSRTFPAPARLVFEAYTKPEHLKRWWAPRSHDCTLAACDADVRTGGKYRYVMRVADGKEMAFSGTYTEVSPPSRLVYTQIFEPMAQAGEAVVTVNFEEAGGSTKLTSRERYPSKEVREQVLASGMEHGARESFQQLDALMAELAK